MLESEDFRIGDRVRINQPTKYLEENIIMNPGSMGTVVSVETKFKGSIRIKMDYDEYEIPQVFSSSPDLTWWGPFEMDIATSRVDIAVKENREEKIKNILDDSGA
jgi:hypothetical protein